MKEGSLEAPTRYAIDWKSAEFRDPAALEREQSRVFDVCHGCRRCVSLCDAFPTLFDLVDESTSMEVDGVNPADFHKVTEQCYLCDLCYMTKCPYVPPHEWAIDFPHLMLRAKAVHFEEHGARLRDRVLTSTDRVFGLATIPLVDVTINAVNGNKTARGLLEKTVGIHHGATLPTFQHRTFKKRQASESSAAGESISPRAVGETTGKVALYTTCYGNYTSPEICSDHIQVFQHNQILTETVQRDKCCGMPKLELGDLKAVEALKEHNIPLLIELVEQGYDLIAPVPSCVLMYKQELPLLFPDDEDVKRVQAAFYDPFEYLWLRHRGGAFNTNFSRALGDVGYQAACHQRVQNIGPRTRDILALIPETEVTVHERCSGHDGTYAVKRETHEKSVKIARPVVRKIDKQSPDFFTSDCPMAGAHLADLADTVTEAFHPMTLLRMSYGLLGSALLGSGSSGRELPAVGELK